MKDLHMKIFIAFVWTTVLISIIYFTSGIVWGRWNIVYAIVFGIIIYLALRLVRRRFGI